MCVASSLSHTRHSHVRQLNDMKRRRAKRGSPRHDTHIHKTALTHKDVPRVAHMLTKTNSHLHTHTQRLIHKDRHNSTTASAKMLFVSRAEVFRVSVCVCVRACVLDGRLAVDNTLRVCLDFPCFCCCREVSALLERFVCLFCRSCIVRHCKP